MTLCRRAHRDNRRIPRHSIGIELLFSERRLVKLMVDVGA